ncbi:thioredoxin [uncultured Ilyobacter sp.]|uniref:thioredoxin n=1 Tax=uncultured Ilyobacter sp. TaxID=544433 RepID=UPI0029C0D62F|nr:thioredoxin [uncultured Ilyobacter sp.]
MGKAVELDEATFKEEALKGKGVVLVDFWAPWCGPCEMMEPFFDELSEEVEAKICKVNVDEYPAIASQYGIRSIPAILIFKDGHKIDQLTGFMHKDDLRKKLEAY